MTERRDNRDQGARGDDGQPERPLTARWFLIVLFLLALLNLLALLSYDPRDAAYLEGGIGGPVPIRNLIGYLGAWVARLWLLLFGFASYILSLALLAMLGRRLLGGRGLRPAGWDYWVGLLLVTSGSAMLFGIWSYGGADLARDLNIAETPGGVIGQRLCGPEYGWMRMVLNPTGSAIVAGALVLVGLAVIWFYDWHELARAWLRASLAARAEAKAQARHEDGQEAQAGEEAMSSFSRRVAGRRAARHADAEEKAAEHEEAEPEPELPLAPAPAPPPRPARPAPAAPAPKPAPAAPLPPEPDEEDRERPARSAKAVTTRSGRPYGLPAIDLLALPKGDETTADPQEIEAKKKTLQETLDSFGIEATVEGATSGPRVTLFEVLPAPGVKVERISQISNNIAMELRAVSLRILAPIPGRKSVGIEVPNANPSTVSLRSLLDSPAWKNTKARIPLVLGRNISGKVVVLDLTQAPHLLIAGATGSGKSVCMNTMIMSMLYRFSPDELRLIMVDPKVVEFRPYHTLPHLVVPVVSDIKKVPLALRWVIKEMEHRYQTLAKVGARNLESFNSRPKSPTRVLDEKGEAIPDRLPFIVVIIDELADIILTARADVETSLTRIAQLSRAVGIHSIIATQRPSVNVITGTIKANFPTRIAFQVTSQVDSRTILDGKGAESLLGRGDMLFRPPGASKLERNQGAFVEDEEIERVVAACSGQADQQFDMDVFKAAEAAGAGEQPSLFGDDNEADEELIQKAIEIIVRDRRATTSYIQRCLRIGYNRAALIMEILEQRGVIGPQVGTAAREILVTGKAGDEVESAAGDVAEDEPEDEGHRGG